MDGLITLQHNNRVDAIVSEIRVRKWLQDQQHNIDQTKQQVNTQPDLQSQSIEPLIDLSILKNTETVNRSIASSEPLIDLSHCPETSTNEQSALSLSNPKASRMVLLNLGLVHIIIQSAYGSILFLLKSIDILGQICHFNGTIRNFILRYEMIENKLLELIASIICLRPPSPFLEGLC